MTPTLGDTFVGKAMFKNTVMKFNEIEMPKNVLYAGLTVLLGLSLYFFYMHIKYPPCCDVVQYINLANIYNSGDILTYKEAGRTFGYPWFLSFVFAIADFINIPRSFLMLLVQTAVYFSAILLICFLASKYSKRLTISVFLLCCCNIYVAPYFGLALTDSLYTSLCLLFYGMLGYQMLSFRDKGRVSIGSILLVILLISFAIIVRPAAVWLVGPYVVTISYVLYHKAASLSGVIVAIVMGTIPLMIQVTMNFSQFGLFTIFPAISLGDMQIVWGIENIKYGTWMGGGAPQNYYPANAFVDVSASQSGLIWYANNPIDGLRLVLVKFIGAFDYDFLSPYPTVKPYFMWLPSILSFTVLWVGLSGIFVHLLVKRLPMLGFRFLPFLILICWGAVNLVSALELRFTLPIVCYFLVVTAVFFDGYWDCFNRLRKFTYIASGALFVTLCIYISVFIRAQSSIIY